MSVMFKNKKVVLDGRQVCSSPCGFSLKRLSISNILNALSQCGRRCPKDCPRRISPCLGSWPNTI